MQLRRRFPSRFAVFTLLAFVLFLPSCKKKETSGGGGDPNVTSVTTSTDHVVFVRLDGKALRNTEFAATPPPTTIVRAPISSAARRVFFVSTSTTESWKP